jgi:hypothetical protein
MGSVSLDALKKYEKEMKTELESVRERIKELESHN